MTLPPTEHNNHIYSHISTHPFVMKFIPNLTALKSIPYKPSFRYEELPSNEKENGSKPTNYPFSTAILRRHLRWRSPSPGLDGTFAVKGPCGRQQRLLLYLLAATGAVTLVCLGGLGYKRDMFSSSGHERIYYDWQRYPRYELSDCDVT